jgi:hypothetical protein
MEREMIIENMKGPKVGTSNKLKLNDFKVEIGQVVKGGNSVYISIGGDVFDSGQISLSKNFSRLNERLSHIVSKSASELFKTLNKRMPFILTHDCAELKTKDKWSYFNLEVTLYFSEGVRIPDINDDLMLMGYIILDYLEDEFVLEIRPHK